MASQLYVLALCLCFAFLIPSNYAIKCYQCSSATNPKCADLSDTSIQPTDCVANQIHNAFNNVFKAFGVNSELPKEVDMICQKTVFTNHTVNRVERSCQFKQLDQAPCDATRSALSNVKSDITVSFCGVCEKDGCNGASSRQLWMPILIAAPIYFAIKLLA